MTTKQIFFVSFIFIFLLFFADHMSFFFYFNRSKDRDTTDGPLEEQKSLYKERNVSVTEEDYMEYNIADACIKNSESENDSNLVSI